MVAYLTNPSDSLTLTSTSVPSSFSTVVLYSCGTNPGVLAQVTPSPLPIIIASSIDPVAVSSKNMMNKKIIITRR